jgi:hypothetical protein
MNKFLPSLAIISFIPFQASAEKNAYFHMSDSKFKAKSIVYEGPSKGEIKKDGKGVKLKPGSYTLTATFEDSTDKKTYTCSTTYEITKEGNMIYLHATEFFDGKATCVWHN